MITNNRIGIVTGTRAEYGLLANTIKLLQELDSLETVVFACGTHLSPGHGNTIDEIVADGVQNIVPVEMLLSTNSRIGIAKSVGLAMIGFADAFSTQKITSLLVLGDRYETLAATQTAMFLDIPIMHIHGGEVTEGAFDDAIRHSITKMANVHFPATTEFANRIQQLGENPKSVFVVGSLGVDNIFTTLRVSKLELENQLNLDLDKALALVTYHPVTKAIDKYENDIQPLINAIKRNPEVNYIITYPNADGGGKGIIDNWQTIADLPNVRIVPSLGFKRYLSVMEFVSCVIGNSSSGIIEAPSFRVPTINIGSRQKGRPRAESVVDVQMDEDEISEAISKSLLDVLNGRAQSIVNPYGNGGAAKAIVGIIQEIEMKDYLHKSFKDYKIHGQ